jgi:hypothetical protein
LLDANASFSHFTIDLYSLPPERNEKFVYLEYWNRQVSAQWNRFLPLRTDPGNRIRRVDIKNRREKKKKKSLELTQQKNT